MHHTYIPQKRNKKKILKEFSKKKNTPIVQRNKMRMIQISNWNNSSKKTGLTFKYILYPVNKTVQK